MYAYSNILAALLQRGKTGRGRRIDVSMLESMAEWMGYPLYYAYDGAPPPPRAGAAHATIYPYGPFAAGDGKSVMLGLQNEREWAVFCDKVLQQPALATDERFDANAKRTAARDELQRHHRRRVRARSPPTQVVARLDAAQIANAQRQHMADLWAHPQLRRASAGPRSARPPGPCRALLPPGAAATSSPPHGRRARAGPAHRSHPARAGLQRDDMRAAAAGAI